MPLTVLLLGVASVVLLVTVDRLSDQWASRDLNTLHTVADVYNAVTYTHLGIQDHLRAEPVDLAERWEELEVGRQLARSLVEGGGTGLTRAPIEPSPVPEVAADLTDLRGLVERYALLAHLRVQHFDSGAPMTTPVAAEYDRVQADLEEKSAELQRTLADRIRSERIRGRWAVGGILMGWILVIAAAAGALWSHEKQRARTEAALREREGQLLQAQKMEAVGRLAGGMAHDINNYLAAIRGQCELVKMKSGPQDATSRRMDLVLATADRASSLIERLLAFSRRQPVQPQVVELNAVVEDLEPMMERLIGADLHLRTRPSRHSCPIHIDPAQIEQVIVNLLINAREAMPTGGDVTLTCSTRRFADADPDRPAPLPPGEYVVLRVADTGIGMSEEVRDRIFEPFFTTKQEASGLGLPTVYGIVTQNGGFVEVDSRPGVGTVFTVLLPRHEAAAPAVPIRRPEGVVPPPRGAGERLLVVDDHDQFRDSLRGLLEGLGYRVVTAADAAQAEARWRSGHFDLLITDVVMPGANGRELAERLAALAAAEGDGHRGGGQGLRVLYVSGYTDDVALRHGIHEGAVDLLQKPFSLDVLARKVREVLERPSGPERAGVGAEPDEAGEGTAAAV